MMRRRHKTAKREPRGAPAAPSAVRSRRRARPDAVVPAELLVRAPVRESLVKAAPVPQPKAPPPPKTPAPRAKAQAEDVILVTGFEPFGGERTNPSWEVCTRLPPTIAGLRVETCRVPCEFRRSIEVVAAAIERHRPALVVCIGQAGGRAHMSVERVAINVDDGRIADNAGMKPVDEAIAATGPPAYFATLPVKAMVAEMRAMGVAAEVSNSAGTFVCNHLMYGVLHFLAASGQEARAGFIHVPYAEEQVIDKPDTPSMAIATMVRGVESAIEAAATRKTLTFRSE